MSIDGYTDHLDAKPDCPICNNGGLLDDGDNYGAVMVPCPCTGKAPDDIVSKVVKSYPIMKEYLTKLEGGITSD